MFHGNLTQELDQELASEARRIYERYEVEVVEHFNFCPWAASARAAGEVAVRVVTTSGRTAEWADRVVEAVLGHERQSEIAVGLIVLPRVDAPRSVFEAMVADVRERYAAGRSPAMALAEFHPQAEADLSDSARLVPFLRRSPDPTIQCVRLSVLEGLRRRHDPPKFVDLSDMDVAAFLAAPIKTPLHEKVAAANQATVGRLGVDKVESALAEIQRDKLDAYQRIWHAAQIEDANRAASLLP